MTSNTNLQQPYIHIQQVQIFLETHKSEQKLENPISQHINMPYINIPPEPRAIYFIES